MEPPAAASAPVSASTSSTSMEPPAPASASTSSTSMEPPAPVSASTSSTSMEPPAPASAPSSSSLGPAHVSSDDEAAANLLHRRGRAMDFEGVDFVRLRLLRSGRPAYVHAAEDGRSVRLDPRRESYNAVWAVTPHFYPDLEINCVLLRGAYGRYLGAPDATACDSLRCPFPSPCCAAKQRDGREYHMFVPPAILWRAVETSRQGAFLLQNATERYLCANSRCLLPCCSGLHLSARGTATQWAVERVPRAAARPDLPEPTHSLFARVCQPLSCLCGREIRWVLADGNDAFDEFDWNSEWYTGRLTIHLKTQLVNPPQNYTVCVRAGHHGELTPLVVNLPRSREPLYIVFLERNTAADDQLIYPDVNAVEEVAAIPEPVL